MEKLIGQMLEMSLSEDFRLRLIDVRPILGQVIALTRAKGGDRRTVYPVAEKAFRAIETLYPDFDELASSDSAFELSLEIQGLNEFYAEFAEFEPSDE